jgi:hypothetical protein
LQPGISIGEEIFCSYGDQYWEDNQDEDRSEAFQEWLSAAEDMYPDVNEDADVNIIDFPGGTF